MFILSSKSALTGDRRLLRMNFNRSDSLKFAEVLNDPKFLDFLKKWEVTRRPSAVRAIFTSSNEAKKFTFLIPFLFL
jgi:hypothetical protein